MRTLADFLTSMAEVKVTDQEVLKARRCLRILWMGRPWVFCILLLPFQNDQNGWQKRSGKSEGEPIFTRMTASRYGLAMLNNWMVERPLDMSLPSKNCSITTTSMACIAGSARSWSSQEMWSPVTSASFAWKTFGSRWGKPWFRKPYQKYRKKRDWQVWSQHGFTVLRQG